MQRLHRTLHLRRRPERCSSDCRRWVYRVACLLLAAAVVVATTRLVVLVVGWLLVRVQAMVARMVLERIALALVVRKPMATPLV